MINARKVRELGEVELGHLQIRHLEVFQQWAIRKNLKKLDGVCPADLTTVEVHVERDQFGHSRKQIANNVYIFRDIKLYVSVRLERVILNWTQGLQIPIIAASNCQSGDVS